MSERIYFQYHPASERDSELLQTIQLQAQNAYGGELTPANQFHLTLMHFGIVNEVLRAIKTQVPDIQSDKFNHNVERMVAYITAVMPEETDVELYAYRRFNPRRSVLVALARVDPEMQATQAYATESLKRLLSESGVRNVLDFISSNHNLQSTLVYRPHISLLRNAGYASEIPQLQESLHLEMVPPNYDLGHERFT